MIVMMPKEINVLRFWRQKALAFTAIVCMITMTIDFSAVTKSLYFRARRIKYGGESRVLNHSNHRSDVYEFTGDVRLKGNSGTIFIESMINSNIPHTIKPYARKYDAPGMEAISAIQIKATPSDKLPDCNKTLDIPAILFSTGGHTHNYFHSITDVMVPLFATSQRFNRDVIFLVINHDFSRFTSEHRKTLESLSRYEVVDIDRENRTLCFPNMIVGLIAHKYDLSIDPSPNSTLSTRNLTKLLRTTYSLKRESVSYHNRPRLLVVSRTNYRRLNNELELVELAQKLGFDSVLQDLGDHLELAAKIVNSFDVMVGVHGAGLTNMVFLPENARKSIWSIIEQIYINDSNHFLLSVVIQIVPWGLGYIAKEMFGMNPQEMKLKYLEYRITANESSLLGKYPNHSQIYTDPFKYCDKIGPRACFRLFYINQDVNLDLHSFKNILLKAMQLMAA